MYGCKYIARIDRNGNNINGKKYRVSLSYRMRPFNKPYVHAKVTFLLQLPRLAAADTPALA